MPRQNVSKRVSVDDVTHYQDDLDAEVSGVHDYGDRSVLLPSSAAVVHANYGVPYIKQYHQYLQSLGIGAQELVPVNGEATLFESIQNDAQVRERVRHEVNNEGCRFDAFCSYHPLAQFVSEMSLDTSQIRSTLDLELVEHLDNKRQIRLLDRELGSKSSFPDNLMAQSDEDVLLAVDMLCEEHGTVILKADDLESGVGTMKVDTETEKTVISQHLDTFRKEGRCWIVERAVVNNFEGSIQWYITPEDEGLQKRFMSRQYMDGPVHQGNGIPHHHHDALPGEWDESVRRELAGRIWKLTFPFARWAKQLGYVGYLGFDFIIDLDTETPTPYLLEANARKTGATYPESVRWQVEASGRLDEACVAMRNCHPRPEFDHYSKVVDELEKQHFAMDSEAGTGIIVANPRCLLNTDDPKCILLCVEDSLLKAENKLIAALACIQS